jgi:hypothetical protein
MHGFLARLSTVAIPTLLEPAHVRLRSYLQSRRASCQHEALATLDNLHQGGAFRWITHGELGAHDLRICQDDGGGQPNHPTGRRATAVIP